ncbi:MAG: pyrroloquinoline quinone-dependent dehydrogenase [Pseudomonadales bacterium]
MDTQAAQAEPGPSVGHYGGNLQGQQYTELDQVGPYNLDALEPAWVYRTGDLGQAFSAKGHSLQTHPLYWQGLLFVTTSSNQVIAIDAEHGTERWRFDPELPTEIGYSESASRGVSLWHGTDAECPDRVFIGTLVGTLHALNARTGALCKSFGSNGTVDLSEAARPLAPARPGAVAKVSLGDYSLTSPAVVVGDRLFVGAAIGDNRAVASERGIVRALDARTGNTLWLWDPIPRDPTDPAAASWKYNSAAITGAANAWAPLSADPELGLLYVPTGSASPDFYGGQRLGDNLYANSVVALDLQTGKPIWHQQLVHHDVWDYDTPAQPTLADLTLGTRTVAALLIVTKTGMLYAFDRRTGEPLYPIEERAVPSSDVPGEQLSPSQPFSTVPALADQRALGPEDAFGLLYFDRRSCAKILREYRSEGIFTPPTLNGSVLNPGWAGGANWGGVAVDQERRIAVVAVNQLPGLLRLMPAEGFARPAELAGYDDWQFTRMWGTPYFMARRIFLSPLGLPCTKPPWGKLVAVDLTHGDILWDQPLGTIADLAPAPVPNFEWGVPVLGGALLTRSGLLIIGAAAEHKLRIYNTKTGEFLKSFSLPAAAIAVPMSYQHNGKQYLAIAAGGHSQMGLTRGDYVLAFRLQDESKP